MSIDTKKQTSIDGVIRAPTDTSCPASIYTFFGIHRIFRNSEDHDSRGVCSSTPSSTPNPTCVTTEDIDRQQQSSADLHHTLGNNRQESSSVDRLPPFTYRVRLPSIDVAKLNAFRNPSKQSKTSTDKNSQ